MRDRYLLLLGAIVVALAVILCRLGMRMPLSGDEVEHVHSGWYVDQGRVPFTDFFQHHHSLFWYGMIPIYRMFGYTITAVKALRIGMFAMMLGIAWFTYRIGTLSTRTREAGLLAVILLLSVNMFQMKAMEIRPDVPQALAGLISIYYLLVFLRDGRRRDLAWCALAAGVAFVVLQKAALLIAVYFALFAWLLFKRRMQWKDALLFGAVSALPMLAYLGWLVFTGSLHDYILTNWLLNLNYNRQKPAWVALSFSFHRNMAFWVLAAVSPIHYLARKDRPGLLKIVAFVGLALLALLLPLHRVHDQYFLPVLPLLCVPAAAAVAELFAKLRLGAVLKVTIVVMLLAQPAPYLTSEYFGNKHRQFKRFQYVLKHTTLKDCVYDGATRFNLFRPDIHYFWYSTKEDRGLDTYNKLTGNRFGTFDPVALIREKKPKIITDWKFELNTSGLSHQYVKTQFEELYIRKDAVK